MIEDIGSAVIYPFPRVSFHAFSKAFACLYAAPAGFYQMPSARSVISRTDTFPSRSSYR